MKDDLAFYSALVLAGSRYGAADKVAMAAGTSHKCFASVGGVPMLTRVVQALLDSGRIRHVIVSIDRDSMSEAERLLDALRQSASITVLPSQDNIGASVTAVTEAIPDTLPLVITTGDNALHTADMVAYFCERLDRLNLGCDVAIGVTDADILLEKYPDGQRAFHRFRDGSYSGCNIYALLTPQSLSAPRAFDNGGQFGKRPWRIVFSVGLLAFLVYKSKRATLDGFMELLSRAFKVNAEPVLMPFAEAPIDVDSVDDWKRAEVILASR
jgi:2-C-methyl-D-erythritol 4-phosphate cytidylyltransferase